MLRVRLGNRIADLRKQRELTQAQLAEAITPELLRVVEAVAPDPIKHPGR